MTIVEKRIHAPDVLTMNTCTNTWVGNLKDNYIPLLTEFQFQIFSAQIYNQSMKCVGHKFKWENGVP